MCIRDSLSIDASKGFGYAWDNFLARICDREAGLENSSMDPATIRAVLERLADVVRAKPSGTGPITGNDLADAYSDETGQAAGEGVLAQLQRLPGLTQRDSEAGSRAFVDHDMLGALQGGAFARQALTGFQTATVAALSELSDRAISMATYLLVKEQATADTLISIAGQLQHQSRRERTSPQLVADCLTVAIRIGIDSEMSELDVRGALVDGACLSRVPLDEIGLRNIAFRNCTIRELAFGDTGAPVGVAFANCLISKV